MGLNSVSLVNVGLPSAGNVEQRTADNAKTQSLVWALPLLKDKKRRKKAFNLASLHPDSLWIKLFWNETVWDGKNLQFGMKLFSDDTVFDQTVAGMKISKASVISG